MIGNWELGEVVSLTLVFSFALGLAKHLTTIVILFGIRIIFVIKRLEVTDI